MSVDLVTILGESGFAEQISELSQFSGQAEEKRATLVEQAQAAEEDGEKRKVVVKEVVAALSLSHANAQADAGVNNDREVEGVFNLVSSLILTHFQSDEEAKPLLERVSSILSAESNTATGDKAIVRYRILSNIFNSLSAQSANRCLIFKALLAGVSANDDVELIADAVTMVPHWLAEWNVSATEKEALLKQIAEIFEAAGQTKRSHDFMLLHLRFLGSSGQSSSAGAAKEAAERTVAMALGMPNVFEFEELSQVEAVKGLQAEPIGQLLRVFLSGQTKDWAQWRDANGSTIERLQLSASQLERKIRLLDLANLCSQSVSRTVPYAEIAKVLDVDVDDVEVWVIDVIRAGLVSGKLSQISQSLRVYKSVYRTFGTEQWKLLESRLSTWEKSIDSILETLNEARQMSSSNAVVREAGIPGADAATARQQQSQITA